MYQPPRLLTIYFTRKYIRSDTGARPRPRFNLLAERKYGRNGNPPTLSDTRSGAAAWYIGSTHSAGDPAGRTRCLSDRTDLANSPRKCRSDLARQRRLITGRGGRDERACRPV